MRFACTLAAVLALALGARRAEAQASGRVGRAIVHLANAGEAEGAAVFVTPRTAFVPDTVGADAALVDTVAELCSGDRCAAVTSERRCEVPACPGEGHLAEVDEPLVEVSPWPIDERGYGAALHALREDPDAQPLLTHLDAWRPTWAPSRGGRGGDADDADQPILWLTPRVAFSTDPRIETACRGGSCERVIARARCAPPSCPEEGFRLEVAEEIADVHPWSADDYDEEVARLRSDPELSAPGGYYGPPVGYDDDVANGRDAHLLPGASGGAGVSLPAWGVTGGGLLGVELDGALSAGSFVDEGGAWLGGSFGLALQLELGEGAAAQDPFDALLADGIGLGVHAQLLARADGGNGEPLVAIGARLTLTNRVAGTAVRLPTVLGALVPEAGALLRSDQPTAGYLAWSLPFALLVAPNLALSLRPHVLVALYPEGSPRELDVLVGVSLGIAGVQLGGELPRSRGSLLSI